MRVRVFALMMLTGTAALIQQDKLKRTKREAKARRETRKVRDQTWRITGFHNTNEMFLYTSRTLYTYEWPSEKYRSKDNSTNIVVKGAQDRVA